MRALITAFGPFRGRAANQSQIVLEQCLRRLPTGWRAELLPVDLHWVRELGAEYASDPALDAWLALGEADVDGEPRLELRARNRYDLRDDAESVGDEPSEGAVLVDGPLVLDARMDCGALVAAMRADGHGIALSENSGSHCCNALLYCALHGSTQRAPTPMVGFLHLPRRVEEAPLQARLVLDALAWISAARGA